MKLKPVVLKFGTGILAREGGCSLDMRQFRRLSAEIASLVASGIPCVVVSSAAVAAGVDALCLPKRPTDLAGKQACAAVGQPLLMEAYARHLARHGLRPAQLLLTHEDIFDAGRRRNASVTLARLLASPGVIPIVNENDTVAVEELRFGDNDRLSAEVAQLLGARLLILLTSADGLLARRGAVLSQSPAGLDKPPAGLGKPPAGLGKPPVGFGKSPVSSGEAVRIPLVTDIRDAFLHVTPEKGEHSTGGMTAKLQAVEIAVAAGVETVIAHGRKKGQIAGAVQGLDIGTRFPAGKNQKR